MQAKGPYMFDLTVFPITFPLRHILLYNYVKYIQPTVKTNFCLRLVGTIHSFLACHRTVCVGAVFNSDIQAKQSIFFIPTACHQLPLPFLLLYLLISPALHCFNSWPIFRSSAFPPPTLLDVVGSALFVAPRHNFARLSQEIAVLYRRLSFQTLRQVLLMDLGLHTNATQPWSW